MCRTFVKNCTGSVGMSRFALASRAARRCSILLSSLLSCRRVAISLQILFSSGVSSEASGIVDLAL